MSDPLPGRDRGGATFWQVVCEQAARRPDGRAFTFLSVGETQAETLTFGSLDRRARAVAVRIREVAGPGARVLLLLPPGPSFITAFLGCLYAGAVAVPAYPPRPGRGEGRIRTLVSDARPRLAMAAGTSLGRLARLLGDLADGETPKGARPDWLAVDSVPEGLARRWRPPPADPGAVAFLQYTSGSTSSPRGVEVTHRSLVANERAIQEAFGQSERSVVVGWLPLYHDMGLIGNVLQPLWSGASCVLMSPGAFLQRPRRWLEAIARYRGTTSGGPDSAYDLVVRRVPPGERAGLDLSSWRVAFNGSEPVRPETMDRFARAFAGCGFRREAFLPCYGLAEATLFVSGGGPAGGPGGLPTTRRVSAAELERGRAVPAEPGRDATLLASSGRPARSLEIRVVDPESRRERRSGEVGEIWVAGESVAAGYFRRPEETATAFQGRVTSRGASRGAAGPERRYLRTGDLGFLSEEGELFVTGRLKDLIIVRGRNLYPNDLERTAEESHPAIRPGGAAAFELGDRGAGALAVVCELERRREGEAEEAVAAARAGVTAEHEVAVARVVAIGAGELPRTSSGKVRRGECRRRLLAGELSPVAESGGVGLRGEPAGDTLPVSREDLVGAEGTGTEAAKAYLAELTGRMGIPVEGGGPGAPVLLDSLQAMELRNRVASDLGAELPLEELLAGVPLRALAERLREALMDRAAGGTAGPGPSSQPAPLHPAASGGAASPVAARHPEQREHPVTPGQRALWLLERLQPSGRAGEAYTVAFAARVERRGSAPPSPGALRRAVEALVARHPALRTVFPAGEDGPALARVLPPEGGALDFVVLESPGGDESESPVAARDELRERLAAEARLPFDLEGGPVVRARVAPEDGSTVLLLAIHHAAVDLWSMELLLDDLARILADEEELAPAPPYAAFARWQDELLSGPAGPALRAFWRRELEGAPAVLDLPADRPRPRTAGLAGARLPFVLDAGTAQGVRALASGSGTTVFTVLLAAFAMFLARLTGREELLVASPSAGRSRSGFEDTVGYFANLLPLRVDLSEDPPFGHLLQNLKVRVVRALEHQDLPFPLVVEEVAPEREPSRHPLVQCGLVLERPHRMRQAGAPDFVLGREGARVELGPVRLEAVALERRAVQLDLLLTAAEAGGVLAAALDYSTALFDRTTVRRWARSFGVVLGAAATEPGRRVSELPLLASSERVQLLLEWNDTALGEPEADTVHALVGARAEEAPEAVALDGVGEGGWPLLVTYGALVRRARARAAELQRLGAGPERGVAVVLEGSLDRSPELVITLLATLEAGSFYVPLDRGLPEARLRAMVAATRPAVAVGRAPLPVEVPGAAVLDPAPAARVRPPRSAAVARGELGARVHGQGLAYVSFTSGSTGEPKGIAVAHRAVVRLVDRPGYVRLGPDETLLELAPVAFDASTFELWGLLASGGRLVIPPPGPVSTDALERDLARHRATTVWLTTGLFHLVVDERPESLRPVRQVLTGGDVVSPEAVRRALATLHAAGGVTVCYGPTECTTFTSSVRFADSGAVPSPVPIGRPIGETRVHVLDPHLRPLPTGAAGELVVCGSGLARGYAGRPAATAERFVPDPASGARARAGSRAYRTGDLTRFGPDGRLHFLGRLDTQVKVRGFRVELAEVEATLQRLPSVRKAAVVRRGDALAAFLVTEEGFGAGDGDAVRRALARQLPAYMVPASFTVVRELPLGSNGKVDRGQLARWAPAEGPSAASREPGRSARRPRSELERTLAALWGEVLEVDPERVDPEASFFDQGGHSLQMVRLHARLPGAVGEELGAIPIAELFDHPSVASLASHLRRRSGSLSEGAAGAALAGSGERAAVRRTAMQRRRQARRHAGETR